jgi:hypothetical protein
MILHTPRIEVYSALVELVPVSEKRLSALVELVPVSEKRLSALVELVPVSDLAGQAHVS